MKPGLPECPVCGQRVQRHTATMMLHPHRVTLRGEVVSCPGPQLARQWGESYERWRMRVGRHPEQQLAAMFRTGQQPGGPARRVA